MRQISILIIRPWHLTAVLVIALLMAMATLFLIAPPLLAQKQDDQVELILGELPPSGSHDYEALRSIAGDVTPHQLPITKCEVWRVRRSRLPALMNAARARNISIKILDRSWNEVLQPMAHVAMDAKQKQMLDRVMRSPAAAAVSMMSAPNASMVEYALTKDMDKRGSETPPARLNIALKEGATVTAIRRHVEIVGNRCTWHGVVEGTEQPVTIVWWGSGRITGTFQHENRVYQLKYLGGGMIGIVETMLDKIPEEHAPMTPAQMQEMRRRAGVSTPPTPALGRKEPEPRAPHAPKGDALPTGESSTEPHSGRSDSAPHPRRSRIEHHRDAEDAGAIGDTRAARETAPPREGRAAASLSTAGRAAPNHVRGKHQIDVMVAYTSRAASHYDQIRTDLIELAIEEANRSFADSQIDNVELRLVHTHLTDYEENGQHFTHLWRMVDRGDGIMEEIPRLRDETRADVVILIVDDPQGCGLATRVAADAEEAYAVVHHECAATSYSIAHEIGHILGARHNRPVDMSTGPFPYGHGFVSPDLSWRSIMSYRASCNGCPRLPVWSTPTARIKGQYAGDALQDNARVIREQAARVAAFR